MSDFDLLKVLGTGGKILTNIYTIFNNLNNHFMIEICATKIDWKIE